MGHRARIVCVVVALGLVALLTTASTVVRTSTRTQPFASLSSVPTVLEGPDAPAITLSAHLFRGSPEAIVMTTGARPADRDRVTAVARARHVPVFAAATDDVGRGRLEQELRRLGTRAVRVVGGGSAGVPITTTPGLDDVIGNDAPSGPAPLVYVTGTPDPSTSATAAAVGATVIPVPVPDPRATGESIGALRPATLAHAPVLALGAAFGDDNLFRERVREALSLPEVPGGGQLVVPGKRMVALYGSPGSPSLGPLGRQDLRASIARVRALAASYQRVSRELVVPAFEIIVTVASASPGPGATYSSMIDPAVIRPWVEAAGRAGIYVTLDLQPGRTDFLTQAKRYAEFLRLPHVGLALDPEWRLKPDQVHLTQIGSVSAGEVNRTGDWLAELTRNDRLPQKLFVLHEFDTDMLANRQQIVTGRPELQTVIHADGHGIPSVKMDTWRRLLVDLPPGVVMGWKNFYTEDTPTLTPAQTMLVRPRPFFVSYQ